MTERKPSDLPDILKGLPTLEVSRQANTSREASLDKKVAYNVNSLEDLVREVAKRFSFDAGVLKK
jgi:hypothetical protein